ncbi:MAG: guanylate kinase [Bacteroidales bacterium]|nr:guanylate kinase [Bacteroidales bacterium]
MDGKIIIFSAPSGSGKTTILKTLIQSDELQLAFSISATSRQQRENEEEGKDYYFFSPERFKQGIANEDFLEWEEVYENQFYGTLKSEIDRLHTLKKNVVFDVDVLGGLNLKRFFGKKALAVFIMPPSMEVLEERLRGRGTETEETLEKRLKKAAYELSFSKKFDYILINDELKESIPTAHQLIFNFLNQHKY